MTAPVRWGILGTANIARAQFLPALRAAEGGQAIAVGSRDRSRGEQWASEYGVERAVGNYEALVTDPEIDAVYVALPNNLHAAWAARALRAGKAVLCEKPLCTSVVETESLLTAARESGSLLWEAFVFPFHRQFIRVCGMIDRGSIGELREIQSNFYFKLRNRQNIRLSPEMYGGALNDVGCYPLRLAQLLFGDAPDNAVALASWAPEGVDAEVQGVLNYAGRRLVLGCGLTRPYDTFTRLLGTEGEIRLTNPFHPGGDDTFEIRVNGERENLAAANGIPSFTPALEHIHRVLRLGEAPRHLANDDSLATAKALAMLHDYIPVPVDHPGSRDTAFGASRQPAPEHQA